MPIDISEQHEIHLTDLTYSASAVGRIDGVVTFVTHGAPGDTARVQITEIKKRHLRAEITKLISPSPDRCPPPCPYFVAGCGGCQWQHVKYETQIASKERALVETLKRIGKLIDVPSPNVHPTPTTLAYRNKVRLAITSIRPQIEFGFKQKDSHTVVPIDRCEIAQPAINQALPQVAELIANHRLFPVEEFTLQTSTTTGEVMLTLIYPKRYKPHLELTLDDLDSYPALQSIFARNGERGKVRWVAGKTTISETVGGISYEIGPETFFQTNFAGLQQLMKIVSQYVESIAPSFSIDAHCGIGTFTLSTAQFSQSVLGIDLQSEAVMLAQKNAQCNNMTNVSFRVGNLAKINKVKADLILLNPPRQGCWSEDIEAVKNMSPAQILYISCNPATLARDLSKLEKHYEICSLDLVDLFPMTYHFETVAWLRQRHKSA